MMSYKCILLQMIKQEGGLPFKIHIIQDITLQFFEAISLINVFFSSHPKLMKWKEERTSQ